MFRKSTYEYFIVGVQEKVLEFTLRVHDSRGLPLGEHFAK